MMNLHTEKLGDIGSFTVCPKIAPSVSNFNLPLQFVLPTYHVPPLLINQSQMQLYTMFWSNINTHLIISAQFIALLRQKEKGVHLHSPNLFATI